MRSSACSSLLKEAYVPSLMQQMRMAMACSPTESSEDSSSAFLRYAYFDVMKLRQMVEKGRAKRVQLRVSGLLPSAGEDLLTSLPMRSPTQV